jgi:lysophospholipase L1-like esterase
VYEDNLRQIIGALKVHGMTVILCTLPKLGWTPLYLKNTDYIDKYNQIIKEFSEQDGVILCDVSGCEKEYIDGVHFTHKGYKSLAKKIADTIMFL